jgi:hypothetical protein
LLPGDDDLRWTSHDGKTCPLSDDARPFVRFRNGAMLAGGFIKASEIKSFWTWTKPPSGYDVVAYLSEDEGEPSP